MHRQRVRRSYFRETAAKRRAAAREQRALKEYREIARFAEALLPNGTDSERECCQRTLALVKEAESRQEEIDYLQESAAELAEIIDDLLRRTKSVVPREVQDFIDSFLPTSAQSDN